MIRSVSLELLGYHQLCLIDLITVCLAIFIVETHRAELLACFVDES